MPAADENATHKPGIIKPPPASVPTGLPPGHLKPAEKQYEFKEAENKIIGELAAKMHFVGLFMLAMGLLVIAIGAVVVVHYGPIVSGVLACLIGLWTQRASMSFRNVVNTEGRDISHLISALDDLRKLYSLQFWLLILGVALALLGLWAVSFGYVDMVG
jgi:hypothetical protein